MVCHDEFRLNLNRFIECRIGDGQAAQDARDVTSAITDQEPNVVPRFCRPERCDVVERHEDMLESGHDAVSSKLILVKRALGWSSGESRMDSMRE